MIRVLVIAETMQEARSIASMLSDDDRLEIVDARAAGLDREADGVDVIVYSVGHSGVFPRRGPPVVVLSTGAIPQDGFGGNVYAWLLPDASAAEISASIIAAALDLVVLSRDQVRRWLRTGQGAQPVLPERLTGRELQVLRMLADGLGNKEIGSRLGISSHTAKFHVAQILGKLGAASRAEAVALGIRCGLIPS